MENTLTNSENLDLVKIIKNSCYFLLYLVYDTIDFCQIKKNKFFLNYDHFYLEDILNEAFDLIRIQVIQKGLQYEVYVEKSLQNLQIFSDSQRIKQVLINLLGNALKFTYKGRLRVSAKQISHSPLISHLFKNTIH